VRLSTRVSLDFLFLAMDLLLAASTQEDVSFNKIIIHRARQVGRETLIYLQSNFLSIYLCAHLSGVSVLCLSILTSMISNYSRGSVCLCGRVNVFFSKTVSISGAALSVVQ